MKEIRILGAKITRIIITKGMNTPAIHRQGQWILWKEMIMNSILEIKEKTQEIGFEIFLGVFKIFVEW